MKYFVFVLVMCATLHSCDVSHNVLNANAEYARTQRTQSNMLAQRAEEERLRRESERHIFIQQADRYIEIATEKMLGTVVNDIHPKDGRNLSYTIAPESKQVSEATQEYRAFVIFTWEWKGKKICQLEGDLYVYPKSNIATFFPIKMNDELERRTSKSYWKKHVNGFKVFLP